MKNNKGSRSYVPGVVLAGLIFMGGCVLFMEGITSAGIANTKHNLSVSGPGTIKAISETEICVFCHTPHGASTELPLWNHQMSVQSYTLPSVATGWANLQTTVQQPDKDSRLCLSCHDGTVALGALVNIPGPGSSGTISMQGTTAGRMPATAYGFIGTNLSGSHPVSIAVNDQLIAKKNSCTTGSGSYLLQYPPPGDPVKLRATGNTYSGQPGRTVTTLAGFIYNEGVQCTSCHDPHLDGAVDFLVKGTGTADPIKGHPGNFSALCQTCHQGTCP